MEDTNVGKGLCGLLATPFLPGEQSVVEGKAERAELEERCRRADPPTAAPRCLSGSVIIGGTRRVRMRCRGGVSGDQSVQ